MPEERASELRSLFFESAQELLQALNEEGLLLERRPWEVEIVRNVRRTVHTLKGDSAACGFREISQLAHELEDILTPEVATSTGARLAEVVLSAADMFDAMLAAYRANMQPPSADPLRSLIHRLVQGPAPEPVRFAPKFAWSEYEQLAIAQAAGPGQYVYNVAVEIDPVCGMHSAALQLVRNVLQEAGTLLAIRPEDSISQEKIDSVEAAIASEHDQDWVEKKCRIPAVVRQVVVEACPQAEAMLEPLDQLPGDDNILELEEPAATGLQGCVAVEFTPLAETADGELPQAQSPLQAASDTVLRVDAERIDTVLNLVGELIIGKSMLHQSVSEFGRRFPKDPLRNKLTDAMAFQAQVLNELQRSVMKIRMVPVDQLFRRFPRLVRDLGKQLGKEVEVQISGQETDLDKSILDALFEPISHLVRNAVDHGLETPQERLAAGKPARGKVRLDAYHQGNQVVIEISDDGRGIDREKVVSKAAQRGIVSPERAAGLSESEALQVIFEPGFSTAEAVTQVSGRGVGMDVVKAVMERLKGTVAVETQVGQGTRFLLRLPLTLAIIKALLLRVNDRLYAVPLGTVLEITRACENEIRRVDGHDVLQLRNEVLTLVRLGQMLQENNLQPAAPAAPRNGGRQRSFVVVIAVGDRKFGLVVETLVGEQELVIKALDDHLVASDLLSGASILGDGTVVLVLNTSAVVERLGRSRAVHPAGVGVLSRESSVSMGARA
jgi:two-component system chemotaxis sensor kinase CheA